MPKNTAPPFQIATRQGDGVGVVYVYGIIGQEREWWLDKEDQQEDITAMAVVNALDEMAKKYDVIQLRVNSPGGSVFEGEAIVNAIRNCTAEVHTYNDGVAASMASTIWLAGDQRFMGRNATLMIHAPISYCFGNAVQMREHAETLDKFSQASAEGIAELTGMDVDYVMEQFFADGKDHWMTYKDVEKMGFLTSGADYDVAQSMPTNVQQMDYIQFLQQFQATPPKERRPSFFSRIREAVAPTQQAISEPEKSEPVTPQELRAAVERGEITVEQLGEIHQELTKPAEDPRQTLTEVIQLSVTTAVQAAMADRDATIEQLRTQVQQLGSAPGAAPAGLSADGDPGTMKLSPVLQDARFFADAARNGTRLFRNPSNDLIVDEA